MMAKKPVIGIVGGVGAGKSTVAAEFGKLGCAVISADELNHEVLRRPEVIEQLHGHRCTKQRGMWCVDFRRMG